MPTISFGGLAIVAAAALVAPLALGLFPRIPLPAIVLEIVLGIVIGPQVLGWVSVDTPIRVLSLLGLAFLLLLAGLEVDYERLRGRRLRLTSWCRSASQCSAPNTRCASPRPSCGCRIRQRRFASARRSPCLPCSSSWPSGSAWRRFSAPFSQGRSSSSWIATRC